MSDLSVLPLRFGEPESLETVEGGIDRAGREAGLLHYVKPIVKTARHGVEDHHGAQAEFRLVFHPYRTSGYILILNIASLL